jgi:amidase
MAGVYGHKPSYAIVPAHGQIPGPPGTLTQADLAVAGPMARTVGDLELGLDLMAGPDRWNAAGWRLELPPPRVTDARGLRVAAWLDDLRCPVEADVSSLLLGAAHALAEAGAIVDTDARPGFTLAKVADTFTALLHAALAGGYSREQIERFAADDADTGLGLVHRSAAIRHREWLSANERRLQMRRRCEEFFAEWDVLLLPVMPVPAIPHDHSDPIAGRTGRANGREVPYWDLATWMAPAGVCLLPATVVPVGLTPAGLPVGIQIVGPYLHDRTTLAAAGVLESLVGGCPSPPGF